AVEREERIVAAHAATVVRYADLRLAAVADDDVDARGGRIERVLDQLLDDRCGTLDDFAGGDLVRERVRQDDDPACHSLQEPGRVNVLQASAALPCAQRLR